MSTTPAKRAMRTATSYPGIDGVRHKLVVEYGIRQIDDNPAYFSVTGELYEPTATGHHHGEPAMSGQLGGLITTHMPWLAMIKDMHLCDAATGEPLHALENSWYWFTVRTHTEKGSCTPVPPSYQGLTPHQRAASYLKCDPIVFDHIECVRDERTKAQFSAVVDSLRPQWERRAEAVREQYLLETPQTSPIQTPKD